MTQRVKMAMLNNNDAFVYALAIIETMTVSNS